MDMMGNDLSPYAQLIQHGLAVANRRMLEWNARLGRHMVIGAPDGTCAEQPAQGLLDEARRSPWWHDHFGAEAAPEPFPQDPTHKTP